MNEAFYRCLGKKESKQVNSKLIICETDEVPDGVEESGRTRTLCTLHVDLNEVPNRHWKWCKNSKNQRYQSVSYDLGMQIKSGGIHFDLRIDGVIYGTVAAKFE